MFLFLKNGSHFVKYWLTQHAGTDVQPDPNMALVCQTLTTQSRATSEKVGWILGQIYTSTRMG